MAERQKPKTIKVDTYRGEERPEVELDEGDALWIEVPEAEDLSKVSLSRSAEQAFDDHIGISLRKLRVDLHNQSYGMISASTGCISNPGGPSC